MNVVQWAFLNFAAFFVCWCLIFWLPKILAVLVEIRDDLRSTTGNAALIDILRELERHRP